MQELAKLEGVRVLRDSPTPFWGEALAKGPGHSYVQALEPVAAELLAHVGLADSDASPVDLAVDYDGATRVCTWRMSGRPCLSGSVWTGTATRTSSGMAARV